MEIDGASSRHLDPVENFKVKQLELFETDQGAISYVEHFLTAAVDELFRKTNEGPAENFCPFTSDGILTATNDVEEKDTVLVEALQHLVTLNRCNEKSQRTKLSEAHSFYVASIQNLEHLLTLKPGQFGLIPTQLSLLLRRHRLFLVIFDAEVSLIIAEISHVINHMLPILLYDIDHNFVEFEFVHFNHEVAIQGVASTC